MQEQNYSNHTRYVPGYHFVLTTLLVLFLGGAIYFVVRNFGPGTHTISALFLLSAVSFIFLFWYARVFALKAQDRAIRAEENLRHFVLTGKLFDPKLRLGQIIALRFASDDEFLELTKRALAENLTATDIKKAIKSWRADNHRA